MIVSDLIKHLKKQDPSARVHFAYNYGDHWRTVVAPEIETIDLARVFNSEYHRMPIVVDEEDMRNEKCNEVVVLSSQRLNFPKSQGD